MSRNALEALKCPQCGGDVELDDNQEYGFCKYCGTKVQNTNFKIIKGEVKIAGNPTVENYMKLGERYYGEGDYENALEYYNKALELEADNWKAVFKRGICLTRLKSENTFNKKYIITGTDSALKIISDSKKLLKKVNEIELDMAYEISNIASNEYNKANRRVNNSFDSNNEKELDEILVVNNYAEQLIYQIDEREGNELEDILKTKRKEILLVVYGTTLHCCYDIIRNKPIENYCEYRQSYSETADKIKAINPNYNLPLESYKAVKIDVDYGPEKNIKIDDCKKYYIKPNTIVPTTNIYNIYNSKNIHSILGSVYFWLPAGVHRIIVNGKQEYELDLMNNDIIYMKIHSKTANITTSKFNPGMNNAAQTIEPSLIDSNESLKQKMADKREAMQPSKTNGFANAALVMAIIEIFALGFGIIFMVPIIICSILSIYKKEKNRGLAIAALIINAIFVLMLLLIFVANLVTEY